MTGKCKLCGAEVPPHQMPNKADLRVSAVICDACLRANTASPFHAGGVKSDGK